MAKPRNCLENSLNADFQVGSFRSFGSFGSFWISQVVKIGFKKKIK